MLLLRFASGLCSVGLAVSCAGVAIGQDYPNRPIRIVATSVGSTTDLVARLVAQGLSVSLGQQVIVDNRGDRVAQEIVAKSAPDGYTLHVTGTGFWVEPLLRKLSYDPVREFLPITLATTSPNVLVVPPTLAAKSVKDVIALAKAKPGALNFASAGTGGSAHLAGELFKSMAAVNIVHVAYKGAGAALSALVGGETQMMFATAGSGMPPVKAGKLTALAVTSAQPSALIPGLPTVAASGLPGYESVSMVSMFAPARTPARLIGRLNQEVVSHINRPEVKERLFNAGVEVVGSTPEQLGAKMKLEMARLGKVIRDADIHGE